MAKDEEPKPEDKAIQGIRKAYEETMPGTSLGYQDFQESILHQAKRKIIDEKGMPEAAKYMNSKDGQTFLRSYMLDEAAKKARSNLKGMDEWQQNMYIGNFLADEQRLAQGLGQKGAMFHYGDFEKVLEPQIAVNDRAGRMSLTNFDDSLTEKVVKSTGAGEYLTDLKDISKQQAAQLVVANNKGGTPIGPDMLKQLGLEDKLKDAYK